MAEEKPDAPTPAYVTAEQLAGKGEPVTDAVPERSLHIESGLTKSPGLEAVPDSFAPATAGAQPVPHVRGPGQNPVDPVAAGLDTINVPKPAGESVTPTGREASGREPATYVEKTAGAPLVKDEEVASVTKPDGERVPGPEPTQSEQAAEKTEQEQPKKPANKKS